MKKIFALLLAVIMVFSMAACSKTGSNGDDTYTYRTYSTALGTNLNPHTWEMSSDDSMMAYIETPLTDMTIKNSTTGEYQWIFVAATDIKDVTADHQDDLTKYNVTLPSGVTASDITDSYVYEIALREGMCWEDGTPINADTYIYSMQQLLDPEMRNYRANNYYSGESALAGSLDYFSQGSPIYAPVVPAYGDEDTPDYSLDLSSHDLYLTLEEAPTLSGYTFFDLYDTYGLISDDTYSALKNLVNDYDFIPVNDETKDTILQAMNEYVGAFGLSIYDENGDVIEDYYRELLWYDTGDVAEAVEWDTVGLYKVDEYTIRYVCQTSYDYYYFLTSCTSNWIVNKDLYESCKQYNSDGSYKSNTYGTSKDTIMSYGAYKIQSWEDEKQVVYVQNEKYFEYTADKNGNLSSTSETIGFQVDGEYQSQYQMQKIVIDVMTDDAAKLAFLKGELDDWTPSADDAVTYSTSEQLYKVDETYTMRLIFNSNVETLQKLDSEGSNQNSVVLSNSTFRKAMSLALDRSEFVGATAGYKAAYSMLSSLYFYDVYEDPASIYRNTDEAMQAICNLYGVEYGDGKAYATLKDAYDSITGYNLTEAKELMATACQELVDAGLYTKGEDIKIQIGWAKGSMGSSDNQQIALLNQYVNAALEGSGFGKITFEGVDNLTNRYEDCAYGNYAMAWGAWGGAAFYPFTMFRVYCDPDYVEPIHEAGCWDPATEKLTLTVNGEEITMTWQEWSTSMSGTGKFADADNETKLQILADLEENYLKFYYCIPVCTTTACYMLSYKVSYYTENYSIMYGFGGTRLMKFNYTDAEWTEYCDSQKNSLAY